VKSGDAIVVAIFSLQVAVLLEGYFIFRALLAIRDELFKWRNAVAASPTKGKE
jgi:hypothetical protein